ncbi:hypothetical protein FA95DRAFT_1606034 [Auriscalpium vulgare]|uniref:Uncharacterized protein n=1 Tax=Auriscalpium vulgare TaxID=40419 RepID=A0ACB8RTB8_9AGAM|nr:hypothetical protein FA95DRAFT_1606034 [Auriscalpium vulgare]
MTGAAPTLHEVLDALERMPALESLGLRRALPRAAEAPFNRTISLPRLASLHLEGSLRDCTRLIGHRNIAPAATVSLEMRATTESPTDFRSFFSAIRTCLGAAVGIPVAALFIGVSSYKHTKIEMEGCWELTEVDGALGAMPKPKHILPDISWDITWSGGQSGESIVLREFIFDTFPTGHLRMLWMTDDNWNSRH